MSAVVQEAIQRAELAEQAVRKLQERVRSAEHRARLAEQSAADAWRFTQAILHRDRPR